MSCSLHEIASIKSLKEIQWICPHLQQIFKQSNEKLSSWDSWEDELEENLANSSIGNIENPMEIYPWLEECCVAVSPSVDLMVIACRNRLAFLTGRLEKNVVGEKKVVLSISWKGTVGHYDQDEITSVICLPIISQKQSSAGAPDWTCIVVGFSSGYVSFYTENGLLLLSQVFEECPVLSLFCRTYVPKNFGACIFSDLSEELIILYQKSVVSIDGFSLLQTLKACRNQAAKAAASGVECLDMTTSLGYKKYSLSEQEIVQNCVASGILPPHLYDRLMYLACSRGFNQGVSSGVPSTSQLLTVGKVPFIGILGVTEGNHQPFIADIAMHYASKIKDALINAATGWLFGNKHQESNNKKDKPKIEQSVPIPFRYSLPDQRRMGVTIKLCYSRRLAAVTDDFGRISLVDIQKCTVLRMFKGYRDAECGWITVEGEWREKWREVSFLIIYAPRRGILEVWLPQQGPRVAAFNVPKDARLLYTPHTFLGANTMHGGISQTIPVVLLNQDGTLIQISIPFHLALSGKTSKQAKDIHLLKTLKVSLRNDSEDHLLKIIKEIQTIGVKLQVLSLVIGSKYVTESLAKGIMEIFNPILGSEGNDSPEVDSCQIDHESRLLTQQLSRVKQLLHLYQSICYLHSKGLTEQLTKEEIEFNLSRHLMIADDELNFLGSQLHDKNLCSAKIKQVVFSEPNITFSSFLHCWEISVGSIDKDAESIVPIQLKKNLADKERRLCELLFGWKCSPSNMELFYEVLSCSGVNFSQLLNLAFIYWLNLDSIDEQLTLHMSFMIFTISIFSQPSMMWNPSNVNPYWEGVRASLIGWCKPLHAFAAILICKGVEAATLMYGKVIAFELEDLEEDIKKECFPTLALKKLYIKLYQSKDKQSSDDSSEDFEGLSFEMVEWNLILERFKKLLPVHKLFNVISKKEGKFLQEFSVKILSTKGRGYLSELIAKWLVEAKFIANDLLELITISLKDQMLEEGEIDLKNFEGQKEDKLFKENDIYCELKDCLQDVHSSFPESMEYDVLVLNLAWEYGALWKKMPNQLSNLEAAALFLRSIKNPFLQHGLGSMMWETWMVNYVQSASNLMDKLRRIPNDRNCLRNIGISEFGLLSLFTISKDILQIIMSGNMASERDRPPKIGKDDFWNGIESSPSLVELTITQKMTSFDLCFLHHQLLCVLCLIVQYSVKNIRLFSLFPERDRAAFFKPLYTSWRETPEVAREVVNSYQLAFLNKVISAAVLALPDSSSNTQLQNPSGLYDCVELGRTWCVSLDALRRHYVCELYSSGLDSTAEQALIMVRDGVLIASQMIVIAGQRLRYLISSSGKSMQVIPLITPPMKQWCMSLDSGNLRSPDQPVEITLRLVSKAISLLSSSSSEFKHAKSLQMTFEMINDSGLFRQNS